MIGPNTLPTRNREPRPATGRMRYAPPAASVLAVLLVACAPTTASLSGETTVGPQRPVGPTSQATTVGADAASVLRIGLMGTPKSLDPRVSSSATDTQVMFVVMEPLLTMTPASELQAHLATNWTIAEDGRSIRLELRDDVRFHDGTTFGSEDVKFTLESADDSEDFGPVDYLRGYLEGVDTPDATTAIVRLNQPAAFVLYDLALIPMMPSEATADFGTRPIGTGPYAFEERSADGRITARRFDGYWGDEASFGAVEFHVFGFDRLASFTDAFVRGRLDLAQVRPVSAVRQLASQRNLVVSEIQGMEVHYVVLNTKSAPLDDPRVRSAIGHLVPRERIADEVFDGLGFAASTVLSRATPWSDAMPRIVFDPERAQALLTEAGVRIERPLTLVANAGNQTREAIAAQLVATFAHHGITVRTELVPFSEYLDRAIRGDFDMLLSGVSDGGNPVRRVVWAVDGMTSPTPTFANPRVAELAGEIARLDVSVGPGADAMRELLVLLAEEAAYAYLVVRPEVGVQQTSTLGWQPHPVAALAYQRLQGVRRGP